MSQMRDRAETNIPVPKIVNEFCCRATQPCIKHRTQRILDEYLAFTSQVLQDGTVITPGQKLYDLIYSDFTTIERETAQACMELTEHFCDHKPFHGCGTLIKNAIAKRFGGQT